jgi:hypothetical protein
MSRMIRHVAGATATRRWLAALVLTVATGCGGSKEKPAPAPAPAPPPAAGIGPQSQGQKQMAARGAQPVAQAIATPVDFETLQTLLPEIEGWKKVRATGEKISLPVPYSIAQGRYARETATIDLEIRDSALSQVLLGAETMFMTPGFEERSRDGYRKAVTLRNCPGYEEWHATAKTADLTVIVANRFVVHGKGRDMTGIEPVRAVVQAVNFQQLAKLK